MCVWLCAHTCRIIQEIILNAWGSNVAGDLAEKIDEWFALPGDVSEFELLLGLDNLRIRISGVNLYNRQ